jgi:hypothetical protein
MVRPVLWFLVLLAIGGGCSEDPVMPGGQPRD